MSGFNSSAFSKFAKMVAASFQDVAGTSNVFVAEIDGDELYLEYLRAFPPDTNPIFKKTTEHDCSCCKHFIRRAGRAVVIENGRTLRTIWDVAAKEAPHPYSVVAERLRDAVRTAPICNLYRVGEKELAFGAVQTRTLDKETQEVVTWQHLHTGEIPRHLRASSPDQVCGDYRTTVQVFARGLTELTVDAVDTVFSLVEANSLYRGEEHKGALLEFRKAQQRYLSMSDAAERNAFLWANAVNPAARFRNTVLGTLVQDLSEGKEVEHAVQSYETKVAPQNYKRTTALITPAMVKKAMETIEALGLESALERRFAVIGDVSVRDVLWVDGSVKPMMKGGIGDVLMQHATSSRGPEEDPHAEDIKLDDFVARVLPEVTSMELLFKGEHVSHLMSLTAPIHPEPKQLFRWTNDFAWSYTGNVADSIRERVKKAGGKVEGVLRVSLSWFNFDDLDLHVVQPTGRGRLSVEDRIYYGHKRGWTGGELDVDMNAGYGTSRTPVENIVWVKEPPNGKYRVQVHNFTQRETSDPGFVVEVESGGRVSHYSYNKIVRMKQTVDIVELTVSGGVVERYDVGDPAVTAANISQEKWGLRTEQYVKVSAVTLSPNYWGDNAVGNKHTFFVIDGAKSDEPARGIYNEFLHPRLEAHRKVFEVIGDKTKCQPTGGQLSGLGFSHTKPASFIVRVRQGKRQRVFNVRVGA